MAAFELELKAKIDDFKKNIAAAASVSENLEKTAVKSATNTEKSFKDLGAAINISTAKPIAAAAQGVDKLAGEVNKSETAVASYATVIKSTLAPALEQTAKEAVEVSKDIKILNAEVAKTPASLSKVSNAGKGAGTTLMNLGRIASDAPFGFIAIQNNLDPLFESFGRLKQETGGVIPALKSLAVGLAGTGGLALAFTAVTAAISYFSLNPDKLPAIFGGTGDAAKRAGQETKTFAETLNDISRASLVGAQNAVEETTKLQLLYRAATDATAGTKLRKQAIDELQKQYPAYFANIKDEIIAAGGAKASYDALATSILAAARARAATSIIETNAKRQLEDDEKINQLLIEQNKLTAAIAKNRAYANQNGSAIGGGVGASNTEGILRNIASLEQQRAGIQQQINNLTTDHTKLNQRNLDLTNKIYEAAKKTQNVNVLTGDTSGVGSIEKAAKAIADARTKFGAAQQIGVTTPLTTEADLKTLNDTVTATDSYASSLLAASAAIAAAKAEQDQLNQNTALANTLTASLSNLFTNAFTAKDPFKAIIQSIGQLIARLLATLAAAAAVAAVLSLIPGFTLAGGATGFSGIFKSLSGLGNLAKVAGGVGSVAAGAVNVSKGDGGFGQLALTTTLSGRDIKVALERTDQSNLRTG